MTRPPSRSATSRAKAALVLLLGLVFSGCAPPAEHGSAPLLLFGRSGVGVLEFNYPRAAALSPDGLLYVVDKAARIQCFTQQGEFLREWRTPAMDAGKPTGLGVGPDGRVYAADTHYARVLVYLPDGTLQRQVGTLGDGPGEFRLPTDVEVDRQGFIYVAEYGGNDRVSKFTPDWRYLFSFGGKDAGVGRMERPQSLHVANDGTLWITDACNHRVCHFDAEGTFLGAFGKLGGGPGELRFPYNVDCLSDGTLIVCEYGNNRVQRFDPKGHGLGTWGAAGREPGQLAYPWAIAVGADDRVFIVDSGNNRVQVIAGGDERTWQAR